MPQHYGFGLDFEFQNYEQQRRQLQRLQEIAPAQVQQSREFVNTFYGEKQQGPCELLPDEELARRCRQGYTPGTYPPGQTYNPVSTYPGDNGNSNGNGNGSNGNGGNGGGDA